MSECSVILFMAKFPDNTISTRSIKFHKYAYADIVNSCISNMRGFYKEPIKPEVAKAAMDTIATACKEKSHVFICMTRLDGKILLHSYRAQYLHKSMLDHKGKVLDDKLANQLRVYHISRNPINNPFEWD